MNIIDKKIVSELDVLFSNAVERKNLVSEKVLNKIINKNYNLKDISITEFHVISCIGNEEEINGIKISEKIGMTRGGVSKVLSNLIKKELIIPYKNDVNKRKIFYKLTPLGEKVNEIYNKGHEKKIKVLINTVNKYTNQEQEIILRFIKDLQKSLIE